MNTTQVQIFITCLITCWCLSGVLW